MTKRTDTPYYYIPRWGMPGHVVLYPRLDYPDRSYLRTRTRPALLTCFTCYRPLRLGEREFKNRHLYHFWAYYTPEWPAGPSGPPPPDIEIHWDEARPHVPRYAKETPMGDVLGGVFIGLVWLLVVAYLVWVGWDALSRLSK